MHYSMEPIGSSIGLMKLSRIPQHQKSNEKIQLRQSAEMKNVDEWMKMKWGKLCDLVVSVYLYFGFVDTEI